MPAHGMRCLTSLVLGVTVTIAGGCASSSSVRERDIVTPASTVVTTASGSTISVETQTQRQGVQSELDLPPKSAYDALAIAYRNVGIEALTRQDAERILGNTDIVARRQIRGQRLSLYLDCGRSATLANNADNYEVQMSVLSQIRPAEEGKSTILTRVDATARPMSTTGNRVSCTSTGELERRIAELVRIEAGSR